METDRKIRKTGILGGTFNPIHIGHLILAQNALEYCKLDEVLIMPSGVSYLKDPDTVESVRNRVKMTELAIEGNDGFVLSRIEADRPGNSYTYETLTELADKDPLVSYYYIIGADTLFSIENWRKPEIIFEKCTVVCAKRNGYSNEELCEQVSHLEEKYRADIILMDIPEVEISSSSIRRMINSGMSCRYYLDDKVIRFITENGLYGYDRNR